jgi:hypothetical protein
MVFSNANRNHSQVAGRRSRKVEQRTEKSRLTADAATGDV